MSCPGSDGTKWQLGREPICLPFLTLEHLRVKSAGQQMLKDNQLILTNPAHLELGFNYLIIVTCIRSQGVEVCNAIGSAKQRTDKETTESRGSAHLAHELFLLGRVFGEVFTDVQHQHWHMLQSFKVESGAESRDAR